MLTFGKRTPLTREHSALEGLQKELERPAGIG
jgi:hypothetical protein